MKPSDRYMMLFALSETSSGIIASSTAVVQQRLPARLLWRMQQSRY